YTTWKPVYQTHTRMVPVTTWQTVPEQRCHTYKTYRCEPVYSERTVVVNTGCWKTEQQYIPGPVVQKCCRQPGTWHFDPCSCRCTYCPGPVVTYCVQCPGRWVCKPVWVPRQEVRRIPCCQYVMREQVHTVPYTVCRHVPCTTYRPECYTTCRMVCEQHT